MLQLLISIIGILLTIFFVIGTHEAGHFYVARWLGVKILRFSIGFGKPLFRWFDKKGTEYVFALIPLGGYVKMLDESEGHVPPNELHLAFNRQPFYKKFLIVLAGPFVNIICALILYWLIFVIGFISIKPVTGQIKPHSIAAESGLTSNQEIVSVDGKPTRTWANVMLRVITHAGNHDQLKLEVENLADKKRSAHFLDLSNWHLEGLNPDPLGSLGISPYAPKIPLIIGMILPKSPALTSNLKLDDKILAINRIPVDTWDDLTTIISNHPDDTVMFTIERQGKKINIPAKIGSYHSIFFLKYGFFGIAPKFQWPQELQRKIKYGPIEAVPHAVREIVNFTYFNFLLFGKMITGKISLQSLGGPVTIFESAGQALNYGFLAFIGFLAFLSISIGIINILPIPGLDGGHLLIQVIEVILRRPLPERVVILLFRLGFAFLFILIIQAIVNDYLRI